MRIVAVIQARMGSTRLPGKVMMKTKGKTVLEHVISRIKQVKGINEIVVATTIELEDEAVVEETERLGLKVFRGSEEDVLSRYYYAAKKNKADIVVRVTSDCPLIDPQIIDEMLIVFKDLYKKNKVDYLSNTLERSFPRGLDAEVFSFSILEETFNKAKQQYEKEHVTPYIYENPEKFKLKGYKNDKDYSYHRWTLATPEDFELITKIYEGLYKGHHDFYFQDIIELFDKEPELIEINKEIEQKTLKINSIDNYKLIKASKNDCDLLYNWINDKEVRNNSFNTELIDYKSHKKWFYDKLNDMDTKIYIFKYKHKSIGVMRLERIDKVSFLVSFSIDKKYRGLGYASKLLKLIKFEFKDYNLIGKVKPDNIGSIKAFQKAKYFMKEETDHIEFHSRNDKRKGGESEFNV